jgi:hypothetical protein
LIAWGFAAFAAVFPEIPLLIAFPLFPLGLLFGIPSLQATGPQPPSGPHNVAAEFFWLSAAGWVIYLTVCLTALLTKRRVLFFVFYGILCALLILNVQGCRAFLKHAG